jgi:Fe2+ transport system protein FeoA
MLIPLPELQEGKRGIIVSIQTIANPHLTERHHHHTHHQHRRFERRLLDMGLTPGTPIVVVKSAPFHGPIEVLVRGSRLALGRRMAHRILVQVNQS